MFSKKKKDQVIQPNHSQVGHAHRSDFTYGFAVQKRLVNIEPALLSCDGVVYQEEVDIVCLQVRQRLVDAPDRGVVAFCVLVTGKSSEVKLSRCVEYFQVEMIISTSQAPLVRFILGQKRELHEFIPIARSKAFNVIRLAS